MSEARPQQNKKLALLLGGSALFAAILIVGTTLALKFIPPERPPERTILPLPATDVRIEYPGGGDGRIQIVEPGAVDSRPVTYREGGFTPAEFIIRSSDPIGCVIAITNTSAAPLRVRVGPHDPAGDPGADYGAIAPGETGILDVRYPGLQEIILHSHDQPEHTFLVRYGEGCR